MLAFIIKAGAPKTPHSGRTLYDHLYNTSLLLKRWGCEEDICRAGLFHSIYGTSIFKWQTIPYSERERVRNLIGERAEQLVYLFSVADRPRGLIQALATGVMRDRITGKDVSVPPDDLCALTWIEAANLKDQGTGRGFCSEAVRAIRTAHLNAPPALLESLSAFS